LIKCDERSQRDGNRRNTVESLGRRLASEFTAKSPEQALATMTAEPYVNAVPLMIGGGGRSEVREFYANHFLSQIPPDMEMVPVSRTIGQGRVVDEFIARFTHSIRMDWLLPGIESTGKRVEVPIAIKRTLAPNGILSPDRYDIG
jgi:carboxymethylenebutenolidase